MKIKILVTFLTIFLSQAVLGQKEVLQSGPMLGYTEMKEAMIWVQTIKEAEVCIKYHDIKDPSTIYTTNIVKTCKKKAFTAHLIADKIEPGYIYIYDVYINNVKIDLGYETKFQSLIQWEWRSDPPKIKFASGSGSYINEEKYDRLNNKYGEEYHIFESIADKKPDFMLWLGDNLYYREPDWNSKTGIIHRNTHTRSTKEMQRLFATVHNYAIWDDHDFGPNNSDKSFWFKNYTFDAFKLFWANPSYGVGDLKGAISYFNWGDCDFFLLDNRYYRDPNQLKSDNKTMLGKEQLEWLKNSLIFSKATFKFIVIGGQFLNTAKVFETYSNNGFDKERKEIINFILNQNIKNIIFITGDRHHSETNILKTEGKPTISEYTSSPLTSGVATFNKDEINTLRIKGSLIHKRNFNIFSITGEKDNRVLTVTFYDSKGKELYTYKYKAE